MVPALGLFVWAGVWAWQSLPEGQRLEIVDPVVLVPVGLLSAAALAINGLEFAVSAWLVGQKVSIHRAMRVSAGASAANVLPIPGAAVVRARALQMGGEALRSSAMITIAVGLIWVGFAGVLAGPLTMSASRVGTGFVVLAGGMAITGAGVGLLRYASSN